MEGNLRRCPWHIQPTHPLCHAAGPASRGVENETWTRGVMDEDIARYCRHFSPRQREWLAQVEADPRTRREHLLVAVVIAEAAGPDMKPVELSYGQIAERAATLERRLARQRRPIPVI